MHHPESSSIDLAIVLICVRCGLTIERFFPYNSPVPEVGALRFRGPMADRTVMKDCVCVVSSLALLVAVMIAPIRPLIAGAGPSSPRALSLAVAFPASKPVRLSVKLAPSTPERVKAVRSEEEEEEESTRTASPPGLPRDEPPIPTFLPTRNLITFFPPLVVRPLRC